MNVVNSAESSALEVYAPAAFHKEGAKAVMLHTAEDRGDAEVTIRLAGLRTVSGRVASAEDHHGLNSAKVKLQDAKDKEFARGAGVDANGEFKVMFVPPGTYNLVVSDVADTETKLTSQGPFTFPSKHILRSYQEAKQTLIVADDDVTGMSIEAVPDKTVKKDEEPSATFSTSDQ